MPGQVWYKLCEFKQRLEGIKYRHEELGHDLHELMADLRTILLALHNLEDSHEALETTVQHAAQLEPIRKPPHHTQGKAYDDCPNHSGKSS